MNLKMTPYEKMKTSFSLYFKRQINDEWFHNFRKKIVEQVYSQCSDGEDKLKKSLHYSSQILDQYAGKYFSMMNSMMNFEDMDKIKYAMYAPGLTFCSDFNISKKIYRLTETLISDLLDEQFLELPNEVIISPYPIIYIDVSSYDWNYKCKWKSSQKIYGALQGILVELNEIDKFQGNDHIIREIACHAVFDNHEWKALDMLGGHYIHRFGGDLKAGSNINDRGSFTLNGEKIVSTDPSHIVTDTLMDFVIKALVYMSYNNAQIKWYDSAWSTKIEYRKSSKKWSKQNRQLKKSSKFSYSLVDVELNIKPGPKPEYDPNYINEGTGGTHTYQYPVCRHYKTVRIGPGKKIKKKIKVGPFMKGPINAPIKVKVGNVLMNVSSSKEAFALMTKVNN